jgi:N-acetylglutamate synthase-like GNAT family acetyltransferase
VVLEVQIRKFNEEDLQSLYRLIQNTIDISYHEAYPKEAIEFFREYHSKEQILNDTATGYTVIAEYNSEVLGTGTLFGTNIRRVFVNPLLQHRGIGKLIVQELERRASVEKIATIDLEASLVSRQFWESLGFVIQREDYVPVRKDQKLCYYKMIKTLDDRQ